MWKAVTQRTFLIACCAAAIVGCDESAWFNQVVSQEEAEAARSYLELLRARNFREIEDKLAPNLRTAETEPTFAKMADLIPSGEPTHVEVVGFNSDKIGDAQRYNVTFQSEFPSKWLLSNVAFEKRADGIAILGMNVQLLPDSLGHINRFTLEGKTILHYLVLAVGVALVVLTLSVLVLAVRTPIEKRKWLWIVFILFGVGQFTFNWTTGEWRINPIAVQFFSVGFLKSGLYAPWVGQLAIPLGAIMFLARRKKLASSHPPVV